MKGLTKLKARATLKQIAWGHERECGNASVKDILGWLRSCDPEDQDIIREVLLEDLRAGLPEGTYGIALHALAADSNPAIASELEAIARSGKGRLQWRDEIIVELAGMGHKPAMDLYLEALDAGLAFPYECELLAQFIKVDPELSLDHATRFLVRVFSSPGEPRNPAVGCARSFLITYRDVDPRYVFELVKRVDATSPSVGHALTSALLEGCAFLQAWPSCADPGLVAIQQELEKLR
ncbi:MAG: hypothetical protein ABSH37_09160 [Bryobacteraceae bacterium]|jgi:hypothetical protein